MGVIGEEESLRINNCLNYFPGLFSFLAQSFDNNVHDFWDHCWEPLEDLVHDATSKLLELRVGLLDELESWVTQLIDLGRDQVNEDIDGWESWQTITLVHLDGLLDVHIVVVRASTIAFEI